MLYVQAVQMAPGVGVYAQAVQMTPGVGQEAKAGRCRPMRGTCGLVTCLNNTK